jgi:FkbM family methyltransferase
MANELLRDNPLYVVDVGASGGIDPRWRAFTPHFKGILFEPDPREYSRLRQASDANLIVLSAALSDTPGETEFHLCRKQQVSSVYRPNFSFITRFPDASRFDVVDRIRVVTNTLDNELRSAGIGEVDFIKVDVQGFELAVLRGGREILNRVIGLEIEVEFAPMYEGQPLFADVDVFLRERGFELFDLRRYFWKRPATSEDSRRGQLVFGEALYFRAPETVMTLAGSTREKVIRAACTYLVYGYRDLAATLIEQGHSSGVLEARDVVLLKAQLFRGRDASRLINFRGKGRIEMMFLALANLFASRNPWAGTDKRVGN